MYDENQITTIAWNPANRKHYEGLGYQFTKFGEKFDVVAKDLTKTSSAIITVICDYCGKSIEISKVKYDTKMKRTLNNKFSCGSYNCTHQKNAEVRYESTRDKNYEIYLERCKEKGYIPLTQRGDYTFSHSVCKYICPKHGYNQTLFSDFIYKESYGCRKCSLESLSQKNRLPEDMVIKKVEAKNNNKILNAFEYENEQLPNLKILCGSCGKIFITSLASLENGDGACNKCAIIKSSNVKMLPQKRVKEIIESVNGNLWLNPDEYVNNHTNNLRILCGSCNKNEFTTTLGNYVYHPKNRCDICTKQTSKGESLIQLILDKYNIRYFTEYKFKDCKNKRELPFDFYLPDYNYCIEFDGEYHFHVVIDEETLKNTQYRDRIKNQYCEDNSIGLIRIPYWEAQNAEQTILSTLNIK